jgi:PAS domain S-box-containing protein
MTLRAKIHALSLVVLITLTVSVVLVGALVIDEIVHSLNQRLLLAEVENLQRKVEHGYNVLRRAGVAQVESYVKRMEREFIEDLHDYSFGKTGRLTIVDGQGRVVITTADTKNYRLNEKELEHLFTEKTGFTESSLDGQDRYWAYTTFAPWNWLIAVSISKAEMFEKRNEYLQSVSFLAAGILLVNIVVSTLFLGRLVRRIKTTLDCAKAVEAGDLSARVPGPMSSDELGSLQTGINSMITTMETRTEELKSANEQLLREVADRKNAEAGLESELRKSQALYDLAVAMTAEQSLDENLLLLAETSRGLLGTDVSYVALLNESTGELHVEATSGIQTAALADVSIPYGEGMGGHVAATGAPLVVEDYKQEIGGPLANLVETAGLTSLIAVPIRTGKSFLGVLYTANRKKTSFSESDTATLALLGNLAAVEVTRGRTEEALRAGEEIYRSLVENIDIGVALINSDFNLVTTNQARLKIARRTGGNFVGKHCYDFFERIDHVCESCPGKRAMAEGKPVEMETERKTKDGDSLFIRIQAFPVLGPDGKPAAFINVVEDVTQRKILEERLRQKAKLEAIGILAGGIAHDFNNLLTAIIGYSDLLLAQIPSSATEHEKVVQISRAADQAASLTRQLLAFGRKTVLEMRVIDLNTAVSGFGNMLRRLIGEDIQLDTILDSKLGTVEADPAQIEQVLMNLAANAKDAMPGGGTLTIETSNVVLDEEYARAHADVQPGPYAMIAVTDTGHGMSTKTLSRIFEPFFTTKKEGRGTGLGLSSVYGIVKQHQGHISVYSEPKHGTTIKVYLPRAERGADQPLIHAHTPFRHGGSETIMVVEDEPVVSELVREVLETLGYRVLIASEGTEALTIAKQHDGPIDLILTDMVLPGTDGVTLAKEITNNRPDAKVLYMSGYSENFVLPSEIGDADDEVHFLRKPFTTDVLASKIRKILGDSKESE